MDLIFFVLVTSSKQIKIKSVKHKHDCKRGLYQIVLFIHVQLYPIQTSYEDKYFKQIFNDNSELCFSSNVYIYTFLYTGFFKSPP